MSVAALAIAWAALAAAAVYDAWRGRVPNVLAAAALLAAFASAPSAFTALAAVTAALPFVALAVPRLVGMGDVKFAAAAGAALGLAVVPWWWVWALLGASLTLSIGALTSSQRSRYALAPALLAAAVLAAAGIAR